MHYCHLLLRIIIPFIHVKIPLDDGDNDDDDINDIAIHNAADDDDDMMMTTVESMYRSCLR